MDRTRDPFSTRCRHLSAGCGLVSCVSRRLATVRMPSATESMPVSRRIFLKLELPLVRKLSFCVVFPDNATCSVFARSTEREVSYRCCLGSFLIAWVRRMSAKHCLELVIASPVCQLLHMVGPAPVSSKVVGDSDSRMSVRSLFFFPRSSLLQLVECPGRP